MKKSERDSELLEMARKLMKKDVEFFQRVFSIFLGKTEDWECLDALREAQIAQEEEKERWSRLEKIEKISEIQEKFCASE